MKNALETDAPIDQLTKVQLTCRFAGSIILPKSPSMSFMVLSTTFLEFHVKFRPFAKTYIMRGEEGWGDAGTRRWGDTGIGGEEEERGDGW